MLSLGSHASELALRAAIHLAMQPPGKLSPTREIAAGTGLPAAYLAKIMRRLISAGLVRVFRGPGGGAELGRPPGSISLSSLVRAVDGDTQTERCIMGMGACSESAPCLLHSQWIPLRAEISRLLEETSLEMLVRAAHEKQPFIPEADFVATEVARRPKSKHKMSKRQKPS
jgi:Rrf2 family iron-sulfur cluster assembly transcriptional regulator